MTDAPVPPPPRPAKSRAGLFVLVGCLGCGGLIALVVLLAGGAAYYGYKKAADLFTPPVEEYLRAVSNEDWEGGYALIDPEWQASMPQESWTAFEQSMHEQLGAFQSLSMRGMNAQSDMGGTYATATYVGHFAQTDANITVQLKYTDGEWRVVGISYDDYGDFLVSNGAEPADATESAPSATIMSDPQESPFAPIVTEYLTAVSVADFDHAYGLLADAWHEGQPKDEWIAFEQGIVEVAGEFRELTGAANADVDGDIYSTDFAASFENGTGDLHVRTVRDEDNNWKLLEVTYKNFESK